jgi:hypothetical protein
MKAPQTRRLDDPDAEAVRRSHHDAIRELQAAPAAALRVINSIALTDGTPINVSHGLGREPIWIGPSCVRGPSAVGMVEELRNTGADRSSVVVLKASGYGATITIDLAVL